MKHIALLLLVFVAPGLQAQTWDVGLGLSRSYLERYDPYNGPSSTTNTLFILGYTKPIGFGHPSRHQLRFAVTAAPEKRDGSFSYGYYSLAAYYQHPSISSRFVWMGGLSLRHETYSLSGYRLYLPPDYQNFTLLTPNLSGSIVRPYLEAGFSYMGALVPFSLNYPAKIYTRFLLEKVISTPGHSGWEGELRRNLKQEVTSSIQIGVHF